MFCRRAKGFFNGKTEKGGPGNRKKFEWNLIALNHRKYFRWECFLSLFGQLKSNLK